MVQRGVDVPRLIAKAAKGKGKATEALGDFLIAAADPAELNWRSRSPAMQALSRAATHGNHSAGYQLMLWVDRMREVFADNPDMLADIANFAGMETEYDAVQWWQEAAGLGSTKAMRYLSDWCSEVEEPDDAIDWMKRAADAGDEEAPPILAELLGAAGRQDEALVWKERSALIGWPYELQRQLWQLLHTGGHAKAVRLFDHARQACERRATEGPEWDEQFLGRTHRSQYLRQWILARSHDALHRLALGGPVEPAFAAWRFGRHYREPSALVHTAILAARLGRPGDAPELIARLDRRQRRELTATLSEGADGSGWFRNWSREGLSLLETLPLAGAEPEPGSIDLYAEESAAVEALRKQTGQAVIITSGWGSGGSYSDDRERLEAAAEGGDIEAALRLAETLDAEGWHTESAEWFERAALTGSLSALGSLTWHHLLRGNHLAGIEAFDRARPACEARLAALTNTTDDAVEMVEEWVNARSNDALNRLALGDRTDPALAVWVEGAAIGHAESLIHPAILAMREGRERDSYFAVLRLARKERDAARTALMQGATADGWFGAWCRDGIRMIDGCPPDDGGTVRIELTGEEACTLRAFIHDRFDGLYCGPRGLIEEADLKLAAESVPEPPAVPLITCHFDPDTMEVSLVNLPDAITQTSTGTRQASVHLVLTDHEASLLHTLTYEKMSLDGAGRILSEVTKKLHEADTAFGGVDLRLNDNRRLQMDSFTIGAKPSSLADRIAQGN